MSLLRELIDLGGVGVRLGGSHEQIGVAAGYGLAVLRRGLDFVFLWFRVSPWQIFQFRQYFTSAGVAS